ncbi:hypothetical protein [Gemmatimonas groenlandica]|uniref:Uncharacterized protein n=1 Tax=Gemmatimonas groenlandica TaxID=2732249 RepID=A0A6M4IYV2_9BACT|nr:hypothetical protein [Gemmatimonas groenlandica]QJR37421.1 hypothetical protein HKW67_18845 [Gemmatimonas groenlandica]
MSASVESLWKSEQEDRWQAALAGYDAAIAAVPSGRLVEHDVWYRTELPALIAARTPGYVSHEEMVRITEWKMARGVWRAPNLVLVRGNTPDAVVEASRSAWEQIPHPTKPVTALVALKGVGAATASALLAVMAPTVYPFFDEDVAAQVPQLGAVAWTNGYYAKYAVALRERSAQLSATFTQVFTPVMVERALWATRDVSRRMPTS